MKSFGKMMLLVMMVPVGCGLLFAVLYTVLVGLTIPQLSGMPWAQSGIEEWMMDIPQNSDAHPSEAEYYGIEMEIPSTYNAVGWTGYSDENAGVISGVPIGSYGGPELYDAGAGGSS